MTNVSKSKKIVLRMTLAEAKALSLVASNGWGDGDFADWLDDEMATKTTVRILNRLSLTIAKAKGR